MVQTYNEQVFINGSADEVQLKVEGVTNQTAALQVWQNSAGAAIAQVEADGRLRVGDGLTSGTPSALIEANAEVNLAAGEIKQGIQSRGELSGGSGAVTEPQNWNVQEMELKGSGGISSVHTTLTARVAQQNTGDGANALVRAGYFEAQNAGVNTGQLIATETQLMNAGTVDNAIAVHVNPAINTGTINTHYGVKIDDVEEGNSNFALHTGTGQVHLGDKVVVQDNPTSPGHLQAWQNASGDQLLAVNSAGDLVTNAFSASNTSVGVNGGPAGNTTNNTLLGYGAGQSITTGYANVAVGSSPLTENTTGIYNTVMGHYALRLSTTGGSNVAIGNSTLYDNLSGVQNVAVGSLAGVNNVGSGNVFIGYQAGYNEAGSNKLYIENTGSSSPLIYGDFATNLVKVNGSFTVTGALAKGSGTFLIDHPLDPGNSDLYHGFIEGPRYDLLYRGKVQLKAGVAEVSIDAASNMRPGTFAALTLHEEAQLWLQNETGWEPVKGKIAAGTLHILCRDQQSQDWINWLIVAERADPFIKSLENTDEGGRLIPEQLKPTLSPKTVEFLLHEQARTDIKEATEEVVEAFAGTRGYPRHYEAWGYTLPTRVVKPLSGSDSDLFELVQDVNGD